MDIEQIRNLRLAEPFRPFLLLLEDGRKFLIDKPYYLGIAPTKKFLLVIPQDDRAVWFAPDHVKEAIVLDANTADN